MVDFPKFFGFYEPKCRVPKDALLFRIVIRVYVDSEKNFRATSWTFLGVFDFFIKGPKC